MEKKQQRNHEIEINIGEIFGVLFRRIKIIILFAVLFGALSVGGTKLFITPLYQSVTKMYVLSQQDGDLLTTADMQTSSYLAKDYAQLVKSRTVAEKTIETLSLDMSPEALIGKITVYSEADTRIVTIIVTDPNPEHAKELADTVREVSAAQIKSVMNSQAVNVVDKANLPYAPVSPNVMKNGIMGALLGAFIAVVVVLAWFFVNDTIQTADDVEKYLNLSTLGTIPVSTAEGKSKGNAKKKKKKKKKAQNNKRR